MTSCPICGTRNLKHISYYESGMGIVEEHFNCSCCNYSFEYAYGTYREVFGKFEFHWDYSIFEKDKGTQRNFFMPIYKAKFMAKRNWHKGLRNKYKKITRGNLDDNNN